MIDETAARALATELFTEHLPQGGWTFGFDRAVRRAGLCDSRARRITVSRHLLESGDLEEIRQVLLHEIAHAIAGHEAAHGAPWRAAARRIGYTGGRTHGRAIAAAPWVGTCPAGHEHQRFRKPTRALACGACSPVYSRAHLIRWRRRDATAGAQQGGRPEGERPDGPGAEAQRAVRTGEDRQSTTFTSFQNAT